MQPFESQSDETKSYDQQMQDDVRAAVTEVNSKAPEPVAETTKIETPVVEPKPTDDRARDDKGRFAAKDDKPIETPSEAKPIEPKPTELKPVDAKTLEVKPLEAKPDDKPQGNPPSQWTPKAKAQWDRLPQVVREEIVRQATAGNETAELAPYIARAKQAGQSLGQALQAYTGIEDLLRRDVSSGFMHIAQNTGLTQHQAGQLFLGLASRLGAVPNPGQRTNPAQNGHDPTTQAPDLNQMLAPVLNPLQQRIEQLDGLFRQQTEAQSRQRQGAAMSTIEQFRQSPAHRYYDNLETKIGDLLEKGVVPRTGDYNADLSAAYDLACRMDPEISEILSNEKFAKAQEAKAAAEREAAAKAKAASRSVTGSPSPGANGASRKASGKSYDQDLNDDVMAALREVSARA